MNTLDQITAKSGSYLFYGAASPVMSNDVCEAVKYSINNPDVMLVDLTETKKSVGIAQIRAGISFLTQKPLSAEFKLLIICNADKMTADAQNAALKTLEDTPKSAKIFLLSPTLSDMLETVQSRCMKVDVKTINFGHTTDYKGTKKDRGFKAFAELLEMPVGERLHFCEDFSKEEKADIIDCLRHWAGEERAKLATGRPETAENIKQLQAVAGDLERLNINTKLALENLFLALSDGL